MEEEKETKAKIISDAVCGMIMLLSIAVFLLIGWLSGNWHPAWVIVVVGGSLCGIVGILTSVLAKKKDKASKFKTISEAICGILVLLSVDVYLCLGLSFGLWHPYWIIIPISGLVCGLIAIIPNTYERLQKIKENGNNIKSDEPKK